MFAVLTQTLRSIERLHERVIARGPEPRKLLNLATRIVPVWKSFYDRPAINFYSVDEAPRITVP